MKIFVTGITGFLGSHVAEALLREGHEVTALARDPAAIDSDLRPWLKEPGRSPSSPGDLETYSNRGRPGPDRGRASAKDAGAGNARLEGRPDLLNRQAKNPVGLTGSPLAAAPACAAVAGRLRAVQGSLSDEGALCEGVEGVDAVVHVAGLIQASSESDYMKVNRDGTEAVLRAVEKRSLSLHRFVLVSSQAAGGPARGGRPVSGEDPARPVSAYGRSKRAGEERALSRAETMDVTILRPPVIFGPRDRMLARIFRAVSRGTAVVWRDGSNAFNVVHAPDVARAVPLAIETGHPSGSIFYTSDDRAFTWHSFIAALAATTGARVRILKVPQPAFVAVAALSTAYAFLSGKAPYFAFDKLNELREPAWLCSNRGAREALGWSPSSTVEEALASTHAWYRSHRLL